MPQHPAPSPSLAPDSLAELVGDGVSMAPDWPAPHTAPAAAPTPWDRIHGVSVPASSALLLAGLSEYGD